MDSLGNIWKHVYLGPRNRSALWLLIIVHYTNTLTYWLTYTGRESNVWPLDRETNAQLLCHHAKIDQVMIIL